ncbi:hypothetical protein HMPREF9005_0449 [Actinomyces sp. oral taxon 178 str. F0338]|nr:hypothetical protein HMPREF9005_0449 [Actinomyces sp. oral taxon 178 str. F0338]
MRPLGLDSDGELCHVVREHPAPSGALRRDGKSGFLLALLGQGAPSTIRCIETREDTGYEDWDIVGQGAPSTIRCIETEVNPAARGQPDIRSGSAQHHQVH